MAERATVFQSISMAAETTPGTAAATGANYRKLSSMMIEPGIKADAKLYRAMGNKYNSLQALGKEWMEAKVSGGATYTEIVFPLASCVAYAAPAQQAATTAYLWTFSSALASADTTKIFTVEQGSTDVDGSYKLAHRFTHAFFNEFGFEITREAFTISGSMMGQRITDDHTLVGAGTRLELVPILPTQCVVKYGTSNPAGTTLTRVTKVSFNISDRFAPIWPINSANTSFATIVETVPKVQLKVMMQANDQGMAMLDDLRNGAKRHFLIQATGDLIASTYYYDFKLYFCGVVSDVSEFSDEDGVYAIEWTLDAAIDTTWSSGTKAYEFQVINKLQATDMAAS